MCVLLVYPFVTLGNNQGFQNMFFLFCLRSHVPEPIQVCSSGIFTFFCVVRVKSGHVRAYPACNEALGKKKQRRCCIFLVGMAIDRHKNHDGPCSCANLVFVVLYVQCPCQLMQVSECQQSRGSVTELPDSGL